MMGCQRGQEPHVHGHNNCRREPSANRQIRRLVLYVHPVRLSAVYAAQVRCRIQLGRLSAVW
jgi:hypothetical protein